jgi:hypothetical protein
MLVFMVGASGGSALLSGDHARFVAVPQRGQKNPARAYHGGDTEKYLGEVGSLRAPLLMHLGE